ncbi:hypothetical protein BKA64DRAFT_379061 [Cadophora sp. MPI-SDFR-AT-0126]|nr:hypothetical protein BKA64DRAFT_379061 [Leotiomycetes sp. MPI-SDFR-AT-0126]
MPSKIQLDENLWFLYICLQKSDLKTIDFNAVGLATGLKPPAARMRYTRLRRQIESGALNTGHGPGFSSASLPPPSSPSQQTSSASIRNLVPKKRKRGKKSEVTVAIAKAPDSSEDGDKKQVSAGTVNKNENTPVDGVPSSDAQKRLERTAQTEKKDTKIKIENHSGSDADFDSQSEDDEDSEDEIPLAKLRKRTAMDLPHPVTFANTSVAGHVQHPLSTIPAPAYSTYATSHSYGYGSPSSAIEGGRTNRMDSARYVPQGFNAFAIGSREGREAFDGRNMGGNGSRGMDGRGLYASPYVGWVDGRGHKDQMGNPGPGWERRERVQERQYQNQRQELGRGRELGSEASRMSV